VTDAAGNESPQSAGLPIIIDTVAPTALAAPDAELDPNSDSGNQGDSLTNDTTPTINGDGATPGDTITLYADDGVTVLGTTIVTPAGTWSITPTTPLPEGVNNLSVTATDPAGNVSPTTALPITVDTVAPTAPPAPDMTDEGDDGFSSNDDITSNTMPSFTAPPVAPGETPNLYIDGVLVPSVYDPIAGTVTPVTPLATGTYNVAFSVTDAAGNESPVGPTLAFEIKPEDNGLFEQLVSDPDGLGNNNITNDFTSALSPVGTPLSITLSGTQMPAWQYSPMGVFNATSPASNEINSLNYDLKGLPLGMDPTLFVQNAVRTLPVTVQHDLYVQAAVNQSQLESSQRNISASSFNSAGAGVADILDPFALGSIEDISDAKTDGKLAINTSTPKSVAHNHTETTLNKVSKLHAVDQLLKEVDALTLTADSEPKQLVENKLTTLFQALNSKDKEVMMKATENRQAADSFAKQIKASANKLKATDLLS